MSEWGKRVGGERERGVSGAIERVSEWGERKIGVSEWGKRGMTE